MLSRVIAIVFLVVLAPALASVAIVIGYAGGPVFDRAMLQKSDVQVWKFRTDSTWFGEWMRRFEIDWWPALWNAVCGEVDVFDLIRIFRR
jgi:lipopolysaccharide/colanic/teichoic acid biosynthesis glycosyltransferase